MTLRLRLMVLVMAVVAAGLIISDVVTYNSLRSFLVSRVDQQLDAAAFPVGRDLLSTSGLAARTVPGTAFGAAHRSGRRAPTSTAGELYGRSQPRRGGRAGAGRDLRTAPERRRQWSRPISSTTPGGPLRRRHTSRPPFRVRERATGPDLYFTTSSSGPGAESYRAVAKPLARRSRRGGHRHTPDRAGEHPAPTAAHRADRVRRAAGGAGVLVVVHGPPRSAAPGRDHRHRRGHRPGRSHPTGVRGGRGNRGGPAGAGLQHHDRRDRGGLRRTHRLRGTAPPLPGRRLP